MFRCVAVVERAMYAQPHLGDSTATASGSIADAARIRVRAQFEQLAQQQQCGDRRWNPGRVRDRRGGRRFADTEHAAASRRCAARPPSWAVGTFTAWDPDARSTVILDVVGDGRVFLRNDRGQTISQGSFRDGSVFWNNGGRSWLAREGPGVLLGDVASGRHFNFRRS
jgi:hypothetical protein